MNTINDGMSSLALSQDPQPNSIKDGDVSHDNGDDDEDNVDNNDDDEEEEDDEKKESYDEDKLTDSILSKWKTHDRFIRFLDGNTNNCSINNLCQVSIEDAMDHIDEWKVDWDMDLTRSEIALVNDPVWRAGLSQPRKYYKPAREDYEKWCVKYGQVFSDEKFGVYHKNYVGMKRADALEKAKALAAGDEEFDLIPFNMMGLYCCLSYDQMDAIKRHYGGENEWVSILDKEINIAYKKWCMDNAMEENDSGRNAFKLWYVECMTLG
jgi:hypothetical protein